MRNRLFLSGLSLLLALAGCSAPPAPLLPIPEEKQVEWQKMETYAFVHFGMNTFNDKEWGYGDADMSTFNPTDLDCEQWVQTFVKSGMKGVILTAKHHDGFCLWPSEYTDYSVKNAPWKGGQGDVVRDLAEACKRHGIKFAVYLSPWDRHQASYGTPEYVTYFHNQLKEVLSRYGSVFEVWFDGANGGDGWYGGANEVRSIDRKSYYDYPAIYNILDSLQPQAIVFSDGGPGCRWVGNESGYAGETNWAFLRKGEVYPGYPNYRELQYGHADGNQWVAAECDVSIRPGWFYHESEDGSVKSLKHLTDLYYKSVGRNATLLLNFPVDKTGRIHPVDSARAVQWHRSLQTELGQDLFAGLTPEASDVRGRAFSSSKATDGDYDTYWATPDGVTSGSLIFQLKEAQPVNRLLIQEYIPLGQRVKRFNVEAYLDGAWQTVEIPEETTTVGYKRILRFNPVTTDRLRVNFLESRGPLAINNVAAYYAPFRHSAETQAPPLSGGFGYTLPGVAEAEARQAGDGNPATTCFIPGDRALLDLGSEQTVSQLTYLPDQSEYPAGMLSSYALYTATATGDTIRLLAEGEFSNIRNNPVLQYIRFEPVKARYLLLQARRIVGDDGKIGIADCGVYK